MSVAERISSLLEARKGEPVGSVRVVDPSPLNRLYITYNTVEDLVRTSPDGRIVPAAMKSYRWRAGASSRSSCGRGTVFRTGRP